MPVTSTPGTKSRKRQRQKETDQPIITNDEELDAEEEEETPEQPLIDNTGVTTAPESTTFPTIDSTENPTTATG